MPQRVLVFAFVPLVATLLAYLLKIFLLGKDVVDIFQTDGSYLKWIDVLHDIPFELDSIPIIYMSTFNISAPEPVGSYLVYLLCLLFPGLFLDYYLDIINVLFIIVTIVMLYRFEVPSYLKLIFLIALSFGYYEFTVLHSTHRLKLALILLISAVLLRSTKPLVAKNFMAFAYLTHFSLFAMLPFLHLLSKNVLKGVEPPPIKLILFWVTIFYSGIIYVLITSGGDVEGFNDRMMIYVGNKMSHAKVDVDDLNYSIMVLLLLLYLAKRVFDRFNHEFLIAASILYLAAILFVVGPSTLLFSLYVMLMPILVAAYGKESPVGQKFIVAFLAPLVIYSLFKGVILAPLPLYYELAG